MAGKLTCVTCEISERSTQRCWLTEDQAKHFHVKPGDFVSVVIERGCSREKAICRVFIKDGDSVGSNNLVVADTVTIHSNLQDENLLDVFLDKLDVMYIDDINVVLVFDSFDDVIEYTNNSYMYTKYIHEILKQYGVMLEATVDCTNHPLGKLLRLEKIIINNNNNNNNNNKLLFLSANSTLKINSIYHKDVYDMMHGEQPYIDLIGIERPYKSLQKYVSIFSNAENQVNSIAILLTGSSGTGKTTLVQKLVYDNKLHLLSFSANKISTGCYPGESENYLRTIFSIAKTHSKYMFTVLFLDDVDCIGCTSNTALGMRMVSQLKALLEEIHTQTNILVIGTASKESMIDSSLIGPGKFDFEVNIGLPSTCDRKKILIEILNSSDSDVNFQELAEQTTGFNRGDLNQFFQNAVYLNSLSSKPITMDMLKKSLQEFQPSMKKGNNLILKEIESIDWGEIGGMKEIKESLQKIIKLTFDNRLRQFDVSRTKQYGVLLYGPPGCCKTKLVKAIANSVNAFFISITSANIYSPYVGDSEKAIAEVFHNARSWPSSIIFFDELDAIVGSRLESNKGSVHEKVLSALLNEMDGIGSLHRGSKIIENFSEQQELYVDSNSERHSKIKPNGITGTKPVLLIIAATNRPDLIDDALIRPGRFDRKLYIPPPDLQNRLSILRLYTETFSLQNVNLNELAEMTENYTGADLQLLCRQAALLAIRQNGVDARNVTHEHFSQALRNVKPSIDEEQLKFYRNYEIKNQLKQKF